MAKCEAWYAQKAQQALEDRDDKGFKYFIAIMNNKFGWEKAGKTEANTTIQIGNMNVLNQLSREDLIKNIQAKLEKHVDIFDVQLAEITSDQVQQDNQS